MGYGRGSVTRYSSDGGIDGMVTTDELGFRPIIDGKRLTKLMLKYELGVTVERVVKVKRVDLDYFEG